MARKSAKKTAKPAAPEISEKYSGYEVAMVEGPGEQLPVHDQAAADDRKAFLRRVRKMCRQGEVRRAAEAMKAEQIGPDDYHALVAEHPALAAAYSRV